MLTPRPRLLIAGLLSCLAATGVAADEPTSTSTPALQVTEVAPGVQWKGQQYVGADSKGRIFLLRASDKLKVYPLEKDGDLGEPRVLQTAPLSNSAPVLDAAMDRHGDWLIVHGAETRLFRSGKEKPLPLLSWLPISVALLDGEPIAAVVPLRIGRVSRRDSTSPPLLLSASQDGWDSLVEAGLDGPPDPRQSVQLRQRFASRLLADSRDTLWLAHLYRYRFSHFSAAGREVLTVEVGEGKIAHREEEQVEDARVALEEERARYSQPEEATISVNTAVPAILDLAEGPDGRIYLLTKGGEKSGLTLDRFDPGHALLERTPVDATVLGAISLAAGRDGLYLVPYNGLEARYLVPWEAIEAAAWQPVDGVEIDGYGEESAPGHEAPSGVRPPFGGADERSRLGTTPVQDGDDGGPLRSVGREASERASPDGGSDRPLRSTDRWGSRHSVFSGSLLFDRRS